ncbi:macrophage-capping protein-like isoform X3 [Alosa sapidissima]|uniref:macrophage-capping protein-like isoform X3 n=1 Tax=Alosa sapidissima TaxID=34773 RepID=UPI001C0A4F21|nr:macrophage-capping protein-like isoform X3 [Alosa sapidissima]
MLPLRAVPGQFSPEVREPGLRAWRVEKMKAMPLESERLGVFFNGDAYLVLSNRGEEGADLHMWMGEKSSRDEQGACAMLAIQLDHFLGGHPVQHRQVQGYETLEFMSLFPNGVSYKEGGVESGFRRAQRASGLVHRLYQVKGKRNVRAKETIVSWSGSKANMFERQKVREIAALIRDTERNSKAQIIYVREGEEPLEMVEVLGPIPHLGESTPEDDTQTDVLNSATLYKVSDATGSMALTMLSDKSPFSQELLERDDCFILDNGYNGKIYVWKAGHGANSEEKMMSLKIADQFIQRMSYPLETQVEILPQGRESILFKQFFKNWS